MWYLSAKKTNQTLHGFAGGRAGSGITGNRRVANWTHQTAQMPPNRQQLTMPEISKMLDALGA
jgi:hypothetical protein